MGVDQRGGSAVTVLELATWEKSHLRLDEMTWPAVAAVSKDIPVVLPIAAVEQHGRHLPVFTDSMLLQEVVRRSVETLGDRVVWAPLLWLGNSHHHLDFAGTLSAAPRTYLDLLGDLIDNLLVHGFRRIVLLNGHGGNIVPAQQAVFEARQRTRTRSRRSAPGRDLLVARRQTFPRRSHDRARKHGSRLRVGDVDDPAPGATSGRRSEPGRAGWHGDAAGAGRAGLDHPRAQRPWPHRRPQAAPRP